MIQICPEYMRLFREIRRFTDDIVLSFFNLIDEARSLLVQYHVYPITYCDGIGAFDVFQSEISFDLALHKLSLVGFNEILASCVSYY